MRCWGPGSVGRGDRPKHGHRVFAGRRVGGQPRATLTLQVQPEAAVERSRWRLRDAIGSFLGFVLLSLAGSYVGVVLLGGDPALVAIGSLLLGWVALAGV